VFGLSRPSVVPILTPWILSSALDGYPEYIRAFERIYPVLMIRLARVGARKQPHYRVVVIEKDRARNGRSVEVVGTYNPRTEPATVDFKRDRIDYWTAKGAQLSETVGKLLAKHQPAAVSSPGTEATSAA
jgi:small subunit ribosomal protein S16